MLKWNVNNVETWCNVSFVLKFHYSHSHNLISCAAQIKTKLTRRSFAADLIGFHFANVSYLYKFRERSLLQISSKWANRNKYLTQNDKRSSAFSAIWSRQENKSTDWRSLINKFCIKQFESTIWRGVKMKFITCLCFMVEMWVGFVSDVMSAFVSI